MKLLMVSPVPTDPSTAGNRARVTALLNLLTFLGHDVTLHTSHMNPPTTMQCEIAWESYYAF